MTVLDPAAIQLTLKCLKESARWSGHFLLVNFHVLASIGTLESDLSQSTPCGTKWAFLFILKVCTI